MIQCTNIPYLCMYCIYEVYNSPHCTAREVSRYIHMSKGIYILMNINQRRKIFAK